MHAPRLKPDARGCGTDLSRPAVQGFHDVNKRIGANASALERLETRCEVQTKKRPQGSKRIVPLASVLRVEEPVAWKKRSA
jgi:hypothetical protein